MAQAKLKVILLRATPDPDELVALGARLCYARADLDALQQKVESGDQRGFVERAAGAAYAAQNRVVLRAEPALCLHGRRL